jgi:hypothetical protein
VSFFTHAVNATAKNTAQTAVTKANQLIFASKPFPLFIPLLFFITTKKGPYSKVRSLNSSYM